MGRAHVCKLHGNAAECSPIGSDVSIQDKADGVVYPRQEAEFQYRMTFMILVHGFPRVDGACMGGSEGTHGFLRKSATAEEAIGCVLHPSLANSTLK